MTYIPPNFNLLAAVYTGTTSWLPYAAYIPTTPPRVASVGCALVYGRRVNVASTGGTGGVGVPLMAMSVLFPALTDVRGLQDNTGFCDWLQVPAGSGRWYQVAFVDDIGKGYSNEHRTASVQAVEGGWTAPYP